MGKYFRWAIKPSKNTRQCDIQQMEDISNFQKRKEKDWQVGNYLIHPQHVLGRGATATVYQAINVTTQQVVAIKVLPLSTINNEVTKYLLECQKAAMRRIKSAYVCGALDIMEDEENCYMVMERLGGTLRDGLQNRGKMCEKEALEMFRKIVIGYTSIVDALIIHRDLKTANIMLKPNGDPVIIDFGYSECILGKKPLMRYNVGSPSYMSPESYRNGRYSEKSDVWALGVIFYEMLTARTLDYGIDIKEYFQKIQEKGQVMLCEKTFSPLCLEVLRSALSIDVEKRGTIHRLKYILDKGMVPKMEVKLNQEKVEKSCNLSFDGHYKPKISLNLQSHRPKPKSIIMEKPAASLNSSVRSERSEKVGIEPMKKNIIYLHKNKEEFPCRPPKPVPIHHPTQSMGYRRIYKNQTEKNLDETGPKIIRIQYSKGSMKIL